MPKNADGLTDKQARFVPLLFELGGNATEAYIQAGYKAKNRHVAEANAHSLMRKHEVATAIEQQRVALVSTLVEKAEISRQWVLEGLKANYERAMTAVPVLDAKGNETGEYTYSGAVANRSLELIGKEIGMFVERSESKTFNLNATMTSDELREFTIDELRRLLGDGHQE